MTCPFDQERGNQMENKQTDPTQAQIRQEYRDAIQAARNALDELEKEIEEELGTESPDTKD